MAPGQEPRHTAFSIDRIVDHDSNRDSGPELMNIHPQKQTRKGDKHAFLKRIITRQKVQWDRMQSHDLNSRFPDSLPSAIQILDSNSATQQHQKTHQLKPDQQDGRAAEVTTGLMAALTTKTLVTVRQKAKTKMPTATTSLSPAGKKPAKRVELSNSIVNVEALQQKTRLGPLQAKGLPGDGKDGPQVAVENARKDI